MTRSGPALVTPGATWSWPALLHRAQSLPPARLRVVVDDDVPAAVTALLAAMLGRGPVCLLSHRWPAARRQDAAALVAGAPWPEGAATVLFTSGSTGAPKAIVHTVENHLHAAAGACARVPFGPGHRWLLSLPLSHIGGAGIVMRALVGGGTLAAPGPGRSWLDGVRAARPTHLSLVAAQLRTLLDEGWPVPGPVLVGGGPVPGALLDEAAAQGLDARPTWGMTETCAQVCTGWAGDVVGAGPPLPGREVRVRGGRLMVRGPMLAPVRVGPDGAEAVADAQGWFDTGDLGHIDAQGRVHITGRADARFVSGGENISPEEVERVLLQRVARACVVDVPDVRWGARPVAFVSPYVPREAWTARFAEQLPRYMWPDEVWPFPDGQDSLKPDRRALRTWAVRAREEAQRVSA